VSLTKFLELEDRLVSRRLGTIEPTVQLLDLRHPETIKTASEASDWAKSIKPKAGKTYILVLAIGASEYYGPNRNGDGFSEAELRKHHKTFESSAHVYRSHVNKDPAKSFGRVVKSFYNEDMHRVELVLEIDDAKAPDIASKIRDGRDLAVSMGCRIKFDVCSICANKAPSRAEYCDHAKYHLNEILPDGRIVFVDNPNPVFFDISVVWRPADRTGYMLKKVARDSATPEFTESSASLGEKVAAREILASLLSKAAEIDKYVEGVGFGVSPAGQDSEESTDPNNAKLLRGWVKNIIPKVLSGYQPLDNDDLGWLSGKKFPRVLASLSDMGVLLTTPEFLRLLVYSLTGQQLPQGVIEKLISVQGDLLRIMAKHPELASAVIETGVIDPSAEPDDEVKEKVALWAARRDWTDRGMMKLASSPVLPSRSPFEGGHLSAIPVRDTATGKLHYTTGSAVRSAQDLHLKALGGSALGSLALAALTNKLLKPTIGDRGLRWLASGGLGAGAFAMMRPKSMRVREDLIVPDSTTFVERTASYVPQFAVSSYADRLFARAYTPTKLPETIVKLGSVDPVLGEQADFDATAQALGAWLLA